MEAMKKKFLNMRSFREITWKSSIDLPMLKSFFSFFDLSDSFCSYTILRATWITLIRTVVLLAARSLECITENMWRKGQRFFDFSEPGPSTV
ncbi:hypothetical protein IGI04_001392 [Brassica rapa subsp. trilocularis]|uniref:Uncharacterized protein n=1 Tax=Brassica rapa subsp. trilocularis TaxID=1813537 RepID=A0ABQ7NSH8_BRACM|nr:hypothetical protein IGI04_001392 [Brassica rapa subsp. trilocularis]